MHSDKEISLKYLFFTFLKIGAISWGGFMALVAVVQKQLVDKDKIIREELLLDGLSLASVLPGAVAINVITYIGYHLRGVKGALVSMFATIIPGFLMIVGLGIIYSTYGELPVFTKFFMGILPAISAVILSIAFSMAQKQVKDFRQIMICLIAALCLLTIHSFFATLFVIVSSAFTGYLFYYQPDPEPEKQVIKRTPFNYRKYLLIAVILLVAVALIAFTFAFFKIDTLEWYKINRTIFLTFSGMSLTLFGGGYVIIPAMHQVIVEGFHWLTTKEFADAIAMGQITPGPVILSATFIGYRVAGYLGACVATLAIFLPPGFVMILLTGFLKKIQNSTQLTAIFKGMRPAIIGMIFSAAVTVSKEAELVWPSAIIFLTVLIPIIRFKVDVVYLIPLAGIAGIFFF